MFNKIVKSLNHKRTTFLTLFTFSDVKICFKTVITKKNILKHKNPVEYQAHVECGLDICFDNVLWYLGNHVHPTDCTIFGMTLVDPLSSMVCLDMRRKHKFGKTLTRALLNVAV